MLTGVTMCLHIEKFSLVACRERISAEYPTRLCCMGRQKKLPDLPLRVWQRVASIMGARNWCRSAASACRAFNNIAWPILLIDCRIERGSYFDQDHLEERCREEGREEGRASSVDPLDDHVWGPDRRRIPEWGLKWALLHWQETLRFIYIYDMGQSVSEFSSMYNVHMWAKMPAPAARLTTLEMHFGPTNERSQEDFAEDDCSEDVLVACLMVCLAGMPNLRRIKLGLDAPHAFQQLAARLGITVDICCNCAYWDTTFVCLSTMELLRLRCS